VHVCRSVGLAQLILALLILLVEHREDFRFTTHQGKLQGVSKLRGPLVQRQAGFVNAVYKLSRALVQRLWQRVGVLLEGVQEGGRLNGGRVRQRRQKRVPENAHHIVVQDAVLRSSGRRRQSVELSIDRTLGGNRCI
jgi:hypothetical protein